MNIDSNEVVGKALAELEGAWNDADGARFGRAFSDDADFVNVRGEHHTGSAAIGAGHQAIFDSIYKGSTVHYSLVSAAPVAEGCLLGHVQATLDVPAGPLQGSFNSTASVLLVEDGGAWKVRSFHNTLVAPSPA